jgi:putative PIN family toxin of toxin-antitoxin system
VRLVIDTNILISALLSETSLPAHLIILWRSGRFDLLTSADQLDGMMRVTRYPKIRERINPVLAARLINEIRSLATFLERLPVAAASPDPADDYLLAMADAGSADFLITGDQRDLLALGIYLANEGRYGPRFPSHAEAATLDGGRSRYAGRPIPKRAASCTWRKTGAVSFQVENK